MVQSGNKYKSIVTGDMHSCAIQVNGLLDCWGDNQNFQLTGNANSALFITVNSKIPLLTGKAVTRVAAGQTSTCAENSDNNTICWGKPSRNVSNTARNPGFVALAASSATSLASEVDDCGFGFQNCAQSCLTDGSGDLLCRNWVASAAPGPLGKVKKPWTDFGVDYTQTDVGPTHACAVTSERDIWCWGMNDFGQFGTGAFSSTDTFEPKVRTNR
jgi:alpha-tubulin suppressor-like RCC1 family protein